MRDFKAIVRPNLLQLAASRKQAQMFFTEKNIRVHLDANENPFNTPHNRYGEDNCNELKNQLGQIKGIWPHCIALANGTDEAVDLVFRTFCVPFTDNVIAIAPTTRNYEERALLNNVECRTYRLNENFQFSTDSLLALADRQTKAVFLCSPNDPTGNLLSPEEITRLCNKFSGVVVVDESYYEFAKSESLVKSIASCNNLIIINSLSKAFASAQLHLAILYAVPEIIRYLHCLIPPHHINRYVQTEAGKMLNRRFDVDKWINQLLEERHKVMLAIHSLPICKAIYPSNANFFLARFHQSDRVYRYLLNKGIGVYDCSHLPLCDDALRISIGLPSDNNALIGALRQYR